MNANSQSNFYLSESKRFKVKVGVFLVLLNQGNLLCIRRHNTGIEDGFYVVPMGGLQEKETLLKAVIREAAEEVNITVKEENLKLAHLMYRKHIQPDGYYFFQQDLFFTASSFSGIPRNMEPHKADDVQFFPLGNLPINLAPFIKHAIQCISLNIHYSEFGIKGSS